MTWFRASDFVSFLLGSLTNGLRPDQALITSPLRTETTFQLFIRIKICQMDTVLKTGIQKFETEI